MSEDDLPSVGTSIGLDIGGTTVRAAVQDADGRILHEALVPSGRLGKDVPAGISALIDALRTAAPLPDTTPLAGVGIGLPGAIHPVTARVSQCPAFPSLHGIDLLEDMRVRLATEVALANDANLAAWAEFLFGGHEARTLVSLALGTGIGAGVVVDGRMLRGEHGAAGEIAELPIRTASGPARLESVVSTTGLLQARGWRDGADVPRIVDEASAGDPESLTAVRRYCQPLSEAVASLVSILDPGVVVMTGGLGARRVVVDTLSELLRQQGVEVKLVISGLGDRAPLVGALALAREVATRTPEPLAPH